MKNSIAATYDTNAPPTQLKTSNAKDRESLCCAEAAVVLDLSRSARTPARKTTLDEGLEGGHEHPEFWRKREILIL
jgi:hypothetical protein